MGTAVRMKVEMKMNMRSVTTLLSSGSSSEVMPIHRLTLTLPSAPSLSCVTVDCACMHAYGEHVYSYYVHGIISLAC